MEIQYLCVKLSELYQNYVNETYKPLKESYRLCIKVVSDRIIDLLEEEFKGEY